MKTIIFVGIIILIAPIISLVPINNNQVYIENVGMNDSSILKQNHYGSGAFIQNVGQEDNSIYFSRQFYNYHVILGRKYFSINNYKIIHHGEEKSIESNIIRYNFLDCNEVTPEGYLSMNYSYHYFIGNNSSGWFENVHLFESVKYENIWDGIDIVFYSENDVLKYDIIVHPFSDIDDIKIQLVGQESLKVEEDRLMIEFGNDGCMVDGDLYCHYLYDDERINVKYVMKTDNIFSFQMDSFDPSRTMIIDPLISSTFIGGGSTEKSVKVLRDEEYIYIVGTTDSVDFPIKPGSYTTEIIGDTDIFVSKFDHGLKNLIFSTFIGGTDEDKIVDFELNGNGDLLLSGYTDSYDYPITSDAYDNNKSNREIFLSKLSNNGSLLLYSTYIGGKSSDYGGMIEIDSYGSILIAGNTGSVDFPNTSYPYNPLNYTEAFLMKFDPTGKNLTFSRTFGGSTTIDRISDMTIDVFNNIYLTGFTSSRDFPITSDAFDDTHNGLSGNDWDIFFMKFQLNSSEIQYSSYFGGPAKEESPVIVCDDNQCIYITGTTASYYNFPITDGCYDSVQDGSYDSFVFKYDFKTISLIFSTYLGGGENDGQQSQDINSIDLDEEGFIYISGGAYSSEFPTTNNSYDTSFKCCVA